MGKYRFKQPAPFTAGLPSFNQQTDLSQLITQFGVPLLQGFAGPGSFMPQMSPAQGTVDQHAMSAHQRNMQANTYNTSAMGNDQVTDRLVGLAAALPGKPLGDMSKEQAAFAASAINHPITKALLGSVMGPENVESILHGQKGDVSALAASTNRIGYFRKGPSGKDRMSAGEMGDFSKDMYRELYEPDGNVDEMVSGASAGKEASIKQLKKAAKKEHLKLVKNTEIETRLTDGADEEETAQKHKEVSRLYKKYVSGGKATDIKEQAAAVTKIEDAVAESKALKRDETSIGQLKTSSEIAGRRGMHGFSAGQAAGIQDDLYERGMLPKALGAMTPAERVKMIQQNTPRDDASMTAMARDYGHKELMKDSSYAKLSSTDQASRLDDELKNFKNKLADTLKEVDKTSSGAKGAKSAVSVEGLGGMDLLGSRVDAKRSGAALKSYAGAVAAVREIFGANGNSNAPMPMLLAALDGLAGGAMGQVSADKIETSLREMNTAAKNAGVGFEELNALSANMQAEGDMRGTAKNVTLKNTVATLSAAQVMRDEGAFSKPRPGAFTQAEALEATKGAIQAGTDSTNARAMGALIAKYNEDPTKYAGSKMEAKIKAYQAGNGDYSYDTKDANGKIISTEAGNIHDEMVSTNGGGYEYAEQLAADEGITTTDFSNAFTDQKHSKPNINPVAQYAGLLAEGRQTATNLARSTVSEKLQLAHPEQTDAERTAILDIISPAISGLTLDSGKDNRDPTEQLEYITQNAEETLKQAFIKSGQSPEKATASAQQAVKDTGLNTLSGAGNHRTATNAVLEEARGHFRSIEQFAQAPTGAQLGTATKQNEAEAAANKKVQEALGSGGSPLARVSDYVAKAGKDGQQVTLQDAIKALTDVKGEDKITAALYEDAVPAMLDLQDDYEKHAVTPGYLRTLTKNDKGKKELLRRAKVEPDVKIDTQKDRDADYTKHLKTLPADEIKKRYLRDVQKGKVADTNESTAAQIAALSKNTDGTSATDFDKARHAPDKKLITEEKAIALAAAQDLGAARGDTPAEQAAHQRALVDIQTEGTGLNNANTDQFVETGMGAAARRLLPKANEAQQGTLAAALTAASLEKDDEKSAAAVTKAIARLPKEAQEKAKTIVAGMRTVREVGLNPEKMGSSFGPKAGSLDAATIDAAAKESAPQNTKMSDEQKKLIKEIQDAKPENKEDLIKGKLSDKESRELLLTLPDDDMREMYKNLPEDQKKSTADNIGTLGTPGGIFTKGGAYRAALGIPAEDAERFAHIHDVITKPAPEKTAEEKAAAAAEASAAAPPAAAKEKTADAAAAEASAAAIPVAAEQAAGTIADAIIAAAETAAATLAKLTDGGLKGSSGHSDAEKTPTGEPAATPAQLADADVKEDAPLPSVEPTGIIPPGAEPATAALDDLTAAGLAAASGIPNVLGQAVSTLADVAAEPAGIIPPTSAQAAKAITSESSTAADVDEDAYGLNDPEAMRRLDQDVAAIKAGKAADPKYARDTRLLGKATADNNYHQRSRLQKRADKLPQTGSDTRTGVFKQGELQTEPASDAAIKERTDAGLTKTSGLSSDETETPVTQTAAPMATPGAQATQSDTLKIPEAFLLMQTLASIGPNNIRAATAATAGTATNITASVDSAAGQRGSIGNGNGNTQPLKLTGTLSMQGLTSAIINAQAQTPIQTEGSGAPLMPDGPQSGNKSPIDHLASEYS